MTQPAGLLPTRELPRESREWVGPLTITLTVDDVAVPIDPAQVWVAAVPVGSRPATGDWSPAVVEPGGTRLGLQADPVSSYQKLGIWVKFADGPETPVLDPPQVGLLIRT